MKSIERNIKKDLRIVRSRESVRAVLYRYRLYFYIYQTSMFSITVYVSWET